MPEAGYPSGSVRLLVARSVNPASASVALSTVWPTDCSRNTANVMLVGLSSRSGLLPCQATEWRPTWPPDFGRKAVAVELGLFHDRRHIAIQLGAVLAGNLLAVTTGSECEPCRDELERSTTSKPFTSAS